MTRSWCSWGSGWLLALLLVACAPAGGGGGGPDAARGTPRDAGREAGAPDAADASGADATEADAMLDVMVADAMAPDAMVSDAMVPDATPDAMAPDAMLDAMVSDAMPSDAMAPDTDPVDAFEPDAAPPLEGCGVAVPRPDVEPRVDGRWWRIDAFPSAHVAPRRVTVYLPADYAAAPDADFPVLYLHDGQNLFDRRAAAFGVEWQVDEAVDALVAEGAIEPLIVVGIDNTAARIPEYTPSRVAAFEGSGRAADYARFLVDELKPWIDARLRTRCAPAETGVGGSSLGGLVSLYLRREHPDVFGRVAALSPSLWWNDAEALGWADALADDWAADTRVWIDGGNGEGDDPDGDGLRSVAEDVEALSAALRDRGVDSPRALATRVVPGAAHNEAAWARRLPEVLAWLWGPPLDGPPDALAGGPLRAPLVPGASAPLRVDGLWGARVRLTLPPDAPALENLSPQIIELAGDRVTARRAGEARVGARYEGVAGELRFEVIADGETIIEVRVPPETPPDDTIYVAGSDLALGAWDPAGLALERGPDGVWSAVLPIAPGTVFQFKITRGTWETVEKGPNGEEIANRVGLTDGVPIQVDVARWVDVPPR